ncbi:MAG: PHP domain-containing protein [Gemmatimonadota bacterium]|nr:PHP domain-containing protein [Gemmatimonadota bacterium]
MTEGGAAAAPSRFVDLHTHSTASDGTLPPESVVAAAHAAGVEALALTDHDTLAGVTRAVEAGRSLGVRVVAGVELSAHDGNSEVHILGLHMTRLGLIESRLEKFREERHLRAARIVERLRGLGIDVTVDMVLQEAGDAAVGRPHIARAMIRAGAARDFREAFDRYLGSGRPAFVAKPRLEISEAIFIVHEAGGLAIWAHPGGDGRRARLEPFVEMGMDGVEIRHPSHMLEDMNRLAALSDFFKLVPSGGSDWHGTAEGPRMIGAMMIPHSWLEKQDALVASRMQPAEQS